MRTILVTVALCALAMPVGAQQHQHAAQPGSKLPDGWHGRVDRANQNLAEVNVMKMGSAFHVVTGPHVILWNPTMTASGTYRVGAAFTQQKAPERLEGYGILAGGRNLDQPGQDYLYFLIRHDGQYMIRHRAGDEVHTLANWTPSDAIRKPGASSAATNTIEIESLANRARFVINGTEVYSIDRVPMLTTDGIVGLRVGHHLDVHVASFGVQPVAK